MARDLTGSQNRDKKINVWLSLSEVVRFTSAFN